MREASILREQDEKISNEVSEFLDSTFYADETSNFVRCDEVELQVQGIDTIFRFDGYRPQCKCDEKTTAQYRNIQTFTLELSFINKNGNVMSGWLLDPHHINNTFLFVWLDDDKVEVALVEKAAILEHLESIGWTRERLIEKEKRIRNNDNEYLGNLDRDGCRFCYSKHLVEQPINVMLKRKTYKDIALFTKQYFTNKFKR